MKEKDRKHYLAKLTDNLVKGKITRRDFLGKAAKVGLSMSALGALSHLPFRGRLGINKNALASTQASKEVMAWVKDVGKPFKGKTVRMATESDRVRIQYTLDCREPDGFRDVYEKPVPITTNTVLRAAAFVGDKGATYLDDPAFIHRFGVHPGSS